MKRILALLLCLLTVGSGFIFSYATELPRVIDDADLLTAEEENTLAEQILELRQTYSLDAVILTTWGTGGKSVQTYADDYYDENGYGCGENFTGVLLLINMDTREWYISTCGDAVYALTDYGLEQLGQEMVYFLSDGDYYMAFENFLNSLPRYMLAYQQGAPVDGYVQPDAYYPQGGEEIVYYPQSVTPEPVRILLTSLLIGAIVALVAVLIMASRMNTAKFQKNAGNYIRSGSYHLHNRQDIFLYSRVTKTAKPQNTGGGHGGGGSSVHRSSGGRSHGGRGGRF